MKRALFTALGLAPAVTGGGLVPGDPGGPVLTTPGTATWATETTDSGIRAVYTITGDTILDWRQLDVPSGDELVFDFVGGANNVANMLGGGTSHSIDGSVFSNGNVSFFSPGSDLMVNGSITARSVTLATLGVNAADFLNGGDLSLHGDGGLHFLGVSGDITATGGDVVMAGGFIDIDGSARISATNDLSIGGHGDGATLRETGLNRLQGSGMGFVLNLGSGNAGRIDIRAGNEIANAGRLQAGAGGTGQIFLEVGAGGQITNEGSGIIIGTTSITGTYNDIGATFDPDEGDAAVAINPSALKIPALSRPDGSPVSREQIVRNDAPMTASADAGRDRDRGSPALAGTDKRSLMKRASFFGMRGGNGSDKPVRKSR